MSNSPSSDSNGSDQTATVVVMSLMLVLAILTVVLRFYTRKFTKAGIQCDDWLIFAAATTMLITAILLLWGGAMDPDGSSVFVNADPDYVYTSDDMLFLQLTFIASLLYFSMVAWTKLGILLMYRRIFNIDRAFRIQLAVVSFSVIGWWIGCSIADLTSCIPLYYSWINNLNDPRYCFNSNFYWFASGICEVIIDIIILTLPIRVVLAVHLSARKKAIVACIFLLCGFVIITGLVKSIISYVPGQRVPSWAKGEIWAVVHIGTGIICASLPIFKPLAMRVSESTLATRLKI